MSGIYDASGRKPHWTNFRKESNWVRELTERKEQWMQQEQLQRSHGLEFKILILFSSSPFPSLSLRFPSFSLSHSLSFLLFSFSTLSSPMTSTALISAVFLPITFLQLIFSKREKPFAWQSGVSSLYLYCKRRRGIWVQPPDQRVSWRTLTGSALVTSLILEHIVPAERGRDLPLAKLVGTFGNLEGSD